ncbi:MogA/MoaB family molybdenum cofactor biosynthesis protein [Halorubrum vacuolatum]|uniref:Molybdenum cofactor biosynthesis protein B n=1 Tax=Halorubrum vacuolatum TaxID=63740 RepID=A0A238UQJ6_HALVU|nr:MogA/MoaB family molybdenum cofactor biosynthesis protein [Halorubrum vacuolatum]SNR24400.1 molybdenum cofactor biosynthesis protein B [Halorubrum vacuolatum]
MSEQHQHDHQDEHERDDHRGHEHSDDRHEHRDDHDHHSHADHHHHDADSVGVAVVTVSSSRTLDADPSGDHLVHAFEGAGHEVVARELVPDDFGTIRETVDGLVGRADVDAVVTTGGTGVTPDDVTPEAVGDLVETELPGFGELFRTLSYEEVGTRTVGSRATAGIVNGVPVFCLPGSENAVRLGVEAIILQEIGHLVGLATRE